MKLIKRITTTLLFTFFLFTLATNAYSSDKKNSFIIKNVNIVDVKNKQILPKRNIHIKDGLIETIFSEFETLPKESIKIYNGNNGYITPGLIDMHVHMYEPAAYLMTLSHGVTHIRIMNGVPMQLEWREKVASGEMVGSTSTVSSPIISGYKGAYLHHGVETSNEAKQAVIKYKKQGYDVIKTYGNLNQDALSAIISEAETQGIPVAKHGPHGSGNLSVSDLVGFQSFEHVEDIFQGPLGYEFSDERLPSIVDKIKLTKVPVTPTLNIYHQLTKLSDEKEEFLSQLPTHYISSIVKLDEEKNQVKRWLKSSAKMAEHNKRTLAFLQKITKSLEKADVKLLVGSDSGVLLSPHGIATHTEMKLMREAGIESFDVLAAATINPAQALKLSDKIGQIKPELIADFIFTTSNPIVDLSVLKEPSAVIKKGHWYTNKELNKMRDDAIEQRSLWQEITTLYEAM